MADRVAVLLTFIVPIIMISLFGAIFGRSHTENPGIRLAFLNQSSAPVSQRIERILDTLKTFQLVRTMKDENGRPIAFDTSSIKEYVRRGDASAALVIPADAYTDTSIGLKIKFFYDPRNEIEMQIVQGMLQKTIMEQIPEVFMESMNRQATKLLGFDKSKSFNAEIRKTLTKYFPGAQFDFGSAIDRATTSLSSAAAGSGGLSGIGQSLKGSSAAGPGGSTGSGQSLKGSSAAGPSRSTGSGQSQKNPSAAGPGGLSGSGQSQKNPSAVGAGGASRTGQSLNDSSANGSPESGAVENRAGSIFSRMIDFQSQQLVGKEIANPNATRSVGGWAMMFLLFTLSGFSNALIDERRNAVFMRMLAAPFSRNHILWSRYLFGTLLGVVQLIVLFIAGSLLFHIDILTNAGNLLLVILLSAATATGFGMLIASFAKSVAQAGALALMLILTMSAVGGAWFPTSLMPAYIQVLSKFSIVYWSISGFMAVLWRGSTFVEILPIYGVLTGIAMLVIAVSMWKFSRAKIL
jgi:hypothetical protein